MLLTNRQTTKFPRCQAVMAFTDAGDKRCERPARIFILPGVEPTLLCYRCATKLRDELNSDLGPQ